MKLIRSEGVGAFFCAQLPTDVPNAVLSQLGARVQHALRAFTPDDQKALATTVRTYPTTPVAWTRLRAPRSLMAAIGDDAIRQAATACELHRAHAVTIDRDPAYERMAQRAAAPAERPAGAEPARKPREEPGFVEQVMGNTAVKSFLRSALSRLTSSGRRG